MTNDESDSSFVIILVQQADSPGINTQQDEQQEGEAPERTAAVAEEG